MPHLPLSQGGSVVPRDLDEVQGIVILGGPQNVTDIARYPWMNDEAALIRKAHAAAVPVIGICLGAQLIAHALGGAVAPREKPAIGFHPLGLTPQGQTETMLAGVSWSTQQFFSCGQEIKQLPPGATLLSGTKTTPVQVFKAGLRTFGFINHFECDRAMLEDLARSGGDEILANGTTLEAIQADIASRYESFARVSDRLCDNLIENLLPLSRRGAA